MDLSAPNRVLIVQIGRVGDMVLMTPLFYEIKRLFPNWEISVLCSPENEIILRDSTITDNVYIFRKGSLKVFSLVKKLRKIKFDLWIDTKPEYSDTSRLLLKYCVPKKSFGYNITDKIFQVDLTRFKKGNHYTDINLSFFKFFDSAYNPAEHRKPVIEINESKISKSVIIPPDKYIITINVSAGQKTRIWQKEKWLKLAECIYKNPECYIIIIGQQDEKYMIDYLVNKINRDNILFLMNENISEVSYIIKHSDLLITADTALVHIASAFDIPQIVLYPDVKWNYERFSPLSTYYEPIFSKNKINIFDISEAKVIEGYKKISGNAESRTRVQNEDH